MTTPTYALDPAEVQVGTANGPGLYVAPVGTPPPADTSAPWESPWEIAGYLADSGPVIASATTTADIKPWQSRSPIRSVITDRTMSVQFVMWQINPLTTALYFDAEVPTAGAEGDFNIQVRSDTDQHQWAVGVDTSDQGRAMRVIFSRATLSAAANMTIAAGAAIPLDVTMTALDNAGLLADVMVGPGGGGANTVTVTNPGTQAGVKDTAIVPLAMSASSSGGGALTYSATGLPAGLAIAPSTGSITGTPTTVETANVTVTATDDTNAKGSCTFSWDITLTTGTTRGTRA